MTLVIVKFWRKCKLWPKNVTNKIFQRLYYLIFILANPFNCNCHMAWFADWLRTKGFTTGGPRCAFPNHLQDRPIHALPSHEFRCTGMYSRRNLDSNIFVFWRRGFNVASFGIFTLFFFMGVQKNFYLKNSMKLKIIVIFQNFFFF